MRYPNTDLFYVKVGETEDWDRVYAYCNGKKVEGAIEASVESGFVNCIKERNIHRVEGDVQILYHGEKPTRRVEIDLAYEKVFFGKTDVTKLLQIIDNYKIRNKESHGQQGLRAEGRTVC